MSAVQSAAGIMPLSEERRRFQRVRVNLLGRYMLADRREFPCQVVDMSPGGMALVAPICAERGERVIAYIDHVGRLEGLAVRSFPNGFAMTIAATPRKRDKLAAQLTWLANQHILGLPEDRRHDRLMPRNARAVLTAQDGRKAPCFLIDVSLSGAAVRTEARPPVGSPIKIGRVPGRVVRHRDDGIAVEFTRLQHPDALEDSLAVE